MTERKSVTVSRVSCHAFLNQSNHIIHLLQYVGVHVYCGKWLDSGIFAKVKKRWFDRVKIICDWNWREWIRYFDEARHPLNFEHHDGHIPMDIREIMKDWWLWTSDEMYIWIETICRFLQCFRDIWTIFRRWKRLQFGRCSTEQLYI